MCNLRRPIVLGLTLLMLSPSLVSAQVGGPPTPPPTLWNFLGIPQGIRKVQGATRNRNGNRPNREPKPPLKAIADPDNLESKDPAIKKAAEVKQAEDLKKQKIKAVKYLAEIGCGCYDIDGSVTEALVASMGDCTEDVRYETVKAIGEAAEKGCCAKCGSVCCCNKEVLTKLAAMAYERDDHGCYLEPSARVRQQAAETLVICCPTETSPVIVPDEPPKKDTPPIQGGGPREVPEDESSEGPRETAPSDDEGPGTEGDRDEEIPPGDKVADSYGAAPVLPLLQTLSSSDTQAARLGSASGSIMHVSPPHRLAHVHFSDSQLKPSVGAPVFVYRQRGDGLALIAELEVVATFTGSANVTGHPTQLESIRRGDFVELQQVQLASDEKHTEMVIASDREMELRQSKGQALQPQTGAPSQARLHEAPPQQQPRKEQQAQTRRVSWELADALRSTSIFANALKNRTDDVDTDADLVVVSDPAALDDQNEETSAIPPWTSLASTPEPTPTANLTHAAIADGSTALGATFVPAAANTADPSIAAAPTFTLAPSPAAAPTVVMAPTPAAAPQRPIVDRQRLASAAATIGGALVAKNRSQTAVGSSQSTEVIRLAITNDSASDETATGTVLRIVPSSCQEELPGE